VKLLVVIDEYTRECLAIEVGRSFTSREVIDVLQYLFAVRGTPDHIRSAHSHQSCVALRGGSVTVSISRFCTKPAVP